jgi:drug/metabolite transporter (DMT)-like permease
MLSSLIAIVAALASALVFGCSSVAEQRSTKRVQSRRALSPKLLLDLVGQPLWVAAIAATLFGFVLQVVALEYGPLALVEPILVCDLIFAVLISAFLRKAREPIIFAGVIACAVGVAGFLFIGRPSGGVATVGFASVLPVMIGLVAAIAACLLVSQGRRNLRPLALALACGVTYGFAAFIVKLVTTDFSGGPSAAFTHWPIYVLAVVGPLGFLLNQNAFQEGTLIAPVMAMITACDPLISVALAYFLLNETLSSSPLAIAGQILALLTMTTGIAVIAYHAPEAVSHSKESKLSAPGTLPETIASRATPPDASLDARR